MLKIIIGESYKISVAPRATKKKFVHNKERDSAESVIISSLQ